MLRCHYSRRAAMRCRGNAMVRMASSRTRDRKVPAQAMCQALIDGYPDPVVIVQGPGDRCIASNASARRELNDIEMAPCELPRLDDDRFAVVRCLIQSAR